MQHLSSSCYQTRSYMDSLYFLNEQSSVEMITKIENPGGSSILCHIDAKTIAANKSHSEAERRRRKRINAHLATLRTLIPNTIKADKASLLAEVVRYLRQLQENTSESADSTSYLDHYGGGMNIASVFPSVTDELELSYFNESEVIVQVTLCYEDRPGIMVDLTRAIKSIQGKVVRAEMATIGMRTKNVLWVQLSVGGDEGLVRLKRELNVVLSKTNVLTASGQVFPGNKRHRMSHS